MYIVKFEDGSRHSAWETKKEALHQAKGLENKGLIKVRRSQKLSDFIENDPAVNCENGYYYV